MMGDIWFYHLERTALDRALPELLGKTLEKGWRALVRSPDPERLAALDAALWTGRDDGFLPHGLASEAHADKQPILLSESESNANSAQCLILLDGAAPEKLEDFERTLIVFDGADEDAVKSARALWKQVKETGADVSYWRQSEAGKWEKQA